MLEKSAERMGSVQKRNKMVKIAAQKREEGVRNSQTPVTS